MCDISFHLSHIQNIISTAKAFLIIDHHITAKDALVNIPDMYKIFDMNHSGCVLTWTFMFPTEPIPELFQYIEDRDIWTKKKPDGDLFVAWFYNESLDFSVYETYLDSVKLHNMIQTKGASLYALVKYQIDEVVNKSNIKFVEVEKNYYFVATTNCTIQAQKSDVGNLLLLKYPNVDFATTCHLYSDEDGVTTGFSLRSDDTHSSVAAIAKKFGGGGHRNASGANIRYASSCLGKEIPVGNLYNQLENIYFGSLELNGNIYVVVYFNCCILKKIIGKYLLQNRYELESGNMQVAQCLGNGLGQKIPTVHISAIYTLSGSCSKYTITCSPYIPLEQKQELAKFFGYTQNNIKDFIFDVTYSGIILELNSKLIHKS